MGRGEKTQREKREAKLEKAKREEAQQAQQALSNNGTLVPGVTVRLDGLKGAPHLNGLTGVCESVDATSGRWTVCLHSSGEKKALKPDNLIFEEVLSPPVPSKIDEQDEVETQVGEEGLLRMASDAESGFVGCGTETAARQALGDGERRIEFTAISSPAELDKCLALVDEFLSGTENAENRPLRGLSFASCSLDAANLRSLANTLKHVAGQALGAFGISKNYGVDREAWNDLFDALPPKAVWLDFGDNKLVDADLAPLVSTLPGREELEKLYLDGNSISDLSMLCLALPDTGITNLDLGDNDVGDTGAEMLARILPKSVIMILVLGTNPISAVGATSLFEALPRSSIDALYLDNTGADDSSLDALAMGLSEMKLTELHLDTTKITDAGVRDLIPYLGESEITFIDVSENGVSDETSELLEKTASAERVLKQGEAEE